MYKNHFQFTEMPFSIAPNPRFLFMTQRHREALAHLLYGLQSDGGIVLLTGEVGTGKTTLCRSMIDQLPAKVEIALILNPKMSAEELLLSICEEFHLDLSNKVPCIKTYIDTLNIKLLANHADGRKAILIIDEAQNLSMDVLEQLRLLTNLETNTHKLLQIFLIGQPELKELLARVEMRQLSQRVIARYHLTQLNFAEFSGYISHRMRVSGASPLIFPEKFYKRIFKASTGVPRLINLICDRALLGAYAKGDAQVGSEVLNKAISEVLSINPSTRKPYIIGVIALLACFTLYFFIPAGSILPATLKSWFQRKPAMEVAAAKPEISLPLSALKVPEDLSNSKSKVYAFKALFTLYGLELMTEEDPCKQTVEAMRCFPGHGGLADLLKINQPVVLKLSANSGREYSATLISLDNEAANLQIADKLLRVSVKDLAHAWLGQYTAIWNVPRGYHKLMIEGQHGIFINWLRHALLAADSIPDNGSDIYDAELAKRLRSFQLSEGIQPDGVIGPQTMMRLAMISNHKLPRLSSAKKG